MAECFLTCQVLAEQIVHNTTWVATWPQYNVTLQVVFATHMIDVFKSHYHARLEESHCHVSHVMRDRRFALSCKYGQERNDPAGALLESGESNSSLATAGTLFPHVYPRVSFCTNIIRWVSNQIVVWRLKVAHLILARRQFQGSQRQQQRRRHYSVIHY